MGCTPCEQKRRDREAAVLAAGNLTMDLTYGCGYDISQLSKWKSILECAKDKNLLEAVSFDSNLYTAYIGVLDYTMTNITDSYCKYSHELGTILKASHVLVALGC